MEKPKVVLLIFASGKIVLTGAKKREEIYEAYDQILPLLSMHRNKAVWGDTMLLINWIGEVIKTWSRHFEEHVLTQSKF